MKLMTQEEFVIKASSIHGGFYDYSATNYISSRSKIKIVCPIHGEFEQTAKQHTVLKRGCKKCSDNRNSDNLRGTKEHFIECARKVHGNKYDYSLVEFKNYREKILIICKKHGEFKQKLSKHLYDKQGCRKCVTDLQNYYNFTKTRWLKITKDSGAYLYLVKFTSGTEEFYKIGITKTLSTRFHCKGLKDYKISVVNSLYIKDNSILIWDLEKELHRECKVFKYKPLKKFDGSRECFSNRIEVKELFNNKIEMYESNKVL